MYPRKGLDGQRVNPYVAVALQLSWKLEGKKSYQVDSVFRLHRSSTVSMEASQRWRWEILCVQKKAPHTVLKILKQEPCTSIPMSQDRETEETMGTSVVHRPFT